MRTLEMPESFRAIQRMRLTCTAVTNSFQTAPRAALQCIRPLQTPDMNTILTSHLENPPEDLLWVGLGSTSGAMESLSASGVRVMSTAGPRSSPSWILVQGGPAAITSRQVGGTADVSLSRDNRRISRWATIAASRSIQIRSRLRSVLPIASCLWSKYKITQSHSI